MSVEFIGYIGNNNSSETHHGDLLAGASMDV